MKIQHFVITRFCCKTFSNSNMRKLDPLSPDNLATRFRLLEMICLPSIQSQKNQDFTWVILVDPDLNSASVNHLAELVLQRPNTILHHCIPTMDFLSLDWLVLYMKEEADYILTSIFDDDDTAPANFVSHLHEIIFDQAVKNKLPVMKTYGFSEILSWDIVSSDKYPFGTISPWNRGTKVSSCGFSFLCKYPKYDFNVMGIQHNYAMELLAFPEMKAFGRTAHAQEKIIKALENNVEDLSEWKKRRNFLTLVDNLVPLLCRITYLMFNKPD